MESRLQVIPHFTIWKVCFQVGGTRIQKTWQQVIGTVLQASWQQKNLAEVMQSQPNYRDLRDRIQSMDHWGEHDAGLVHTLGL